MSDLIDAVIKTRETAANIFAKSLIDIEGSSEVAVRDKILSEVKNHKELFETGWYDPPTGGVAVLFDSYPFQRLKYDSLRKPEYEASEKQKFEEESVGMIYSSLVDKKSGMLGDIGFPVYTGKNEKIKRHISNACEAILKVAEYVKVGMAFSDICTFSENLFQNKFKPTRWIIVSKDLNQPTNLGHTIPGSFSKIAFSDNIKETREIIRKNRVFIVSNENFKIPETCGITIESRLEDYNDPSMPSVYFHFIVCFDKGKKTILENFQEIFKTVGMDYMLKK